MVLLPLLLLVTAQTPAPPASPAPRPTSSGKKSGAKPKKAAPPPSVPAPAPGADEAKADVSPEAVPKANPLRGLGRTPEEQRQLDDIAQAIDSYEAEAAEFRRDVQLVGTARFLGRSDHILQLLAGRRHHRGGYRTFDEWSVDEPDMPVAVAVEHLAHGEDGAPEVAQQQHTVALIGTVYRRPDELVRGAEASVLVTAGRLDMDVRPCHLTGEKGQPRSQLGAM